MCIYGWCRSKTTDETAEAMAAWEDLRADTPSLDAALQREALKVCEDGFVVVFQMIWCGY
jgi:hypothetical protein